ncbi:MAG: 50S ribosomal protein L13 [Candidatus Thermoplasmatota archaeon]|nr:50S ribosomal protein L13 [Candidatus Thermoplasmatota archaeon]MBS3790755.1 50S ribosomal protein L13 [Candidatus Thermoplasmatota archaeon]
MKVYDAEDKILGRLASQVASDILDGEEVKVVNAEKTFIAGDKENILEKYEQRRARGKQMNGPYFPRRPERIFRRTVRGMIPHQKPRGRKAFKRLRAYIGTPSELENEDIIDPDVKDRTGKLGLTLEEISEHLGAKF